MGASMVGVKFSIPLGRVYAKARQRALTQVKKLDFKRLRRSGLCEGLRFLDKAGRPEQSVGIRS